MMAEFIDQVRLVSGDQDASRMAGLLLTIGGSLALCVGLLILYGLHGIIQTFVDQPSRIAHAKAEAEIARAQADLAIANANAGTAQATALSNAIAQPFSMPSYPPPNVRQFTSRPVQPIKPKGVVLQDSEDEQVTESGGRLLIEIAGTEKDLDKGFVYIIKGNTHYKIGKAKNIQSRLAQLATGHEHGLTVYHSIASNAMSRAEASLHTRFAGQRGRGEWFNLTEPQLAYLKSIARIDVAGFPETQPLTTKDDAPVVTYSGNITAGVSSNGTAPA